MEYEKYVVSIFELILCLIVFEKWYYSWFVVLYCEKMDLFDLFGLLLYIGIILWIF